MAAPAADRKPHDRPLRLFFALWPEPVTAALLLHRAQALRADCGGRPTPRDNLHLTLAFLGAIPPRRIALLLGIGAAVAGSVAPFSLSLDRIECWRRQDLVWAGPAAPSAALHDLVKRLWQSLHVAGLDPERRAFKPHVTLLRNIDAVPEVTICDPIAWLVGELVLACSEKGPGGVRYRVIGRWPLAGG